MYDDMMLGGDAHEWNYLDSPVPENLDEPFMYWLTVMPIAPRRKTEGGILLPDQVRDAEDFMNALGRIVKIGAGCFQSDKFRHDLKMDVFPEVGDIIRYSGARNRQWLFRGVTMVDIRDDMIRGLVSPENVEAYQFWK